MKKFFILILLFFGVFLVSCSETQEQTGNPETDEKTVVETETKEYTYTPSESVLYFSDENADKVITEPTFDITQITKDAGRDTKLYQIFGNGMCLQRDAINRIWGKAAGTKYVAAEINGQVYYGTVKSREFEIYLPKMEAGGPYELTIITEAGRTKLTDVYIGEVYLLSGQSNMEFQPAHTSTKDIYLTSDLKNEQIRMLQVGWLTPEEPTTEIINSCKWTSSSKSTVTNFTALGYLFGKKMQEELGCPVGLIANPVGGSSIEFWLSQENYEEVQKTYKSYTTNDVFMTPCLGYNGMLYPLAGYNIRGVVWYQGESNAFGTQQYYDTALEIFINQCREMFNNEQLSFTICELARFNERPLAYSTINEKINVVADKDPYVVVARNLDQGDWFDIHPVDKRELANRTAYETLRVFFAKNKTAPVDVLSYEFNADGSVTITLSKDANLVNSTNGFEVYVNGQYSYDCEVSITGNVITVKANGEITKVRYGYTCKMTSEIQNDVSKMVTVYDNDGFPLDLFLISK